jgi:tetratricopeptide (TPR) repeat protein
LVPEDEIRHDRILFLGSKATQRDSIEKAFRNEAYSVDFAPDVASVPSLLEQYRPGVLVHDWHASDPTAAGVLHRQLGSRLAFATLCRVIYAHEVTPDIVGLASDCGVRRVTVYGTILNLTTEVKMAHTAMRNVSDLLMLVHRVRAGGAYDQLEVDECVERANRSYPHDPIVRVEFGNLCLRREKTSQAMDIAKNLLASDPLNVRAMHLLARCLMETDKPAATAVLEKANVLSPLNTERLVLLADLFFEGGKLEKARELYKKAVTVDPKNLEAIKRLGQISLESGDVNAALDLLRSSVSEEEATSFFNNAAVHASKAGKVEFALRLYLAALSVARSDELKAVVNFNLALTHDRLGRYPEALENLNAVLALSPGHERALRQKARIEKLLANQS